MSVPHLCPVPLMIATDSPADAQLIESLLEDDFSHIRHHLDSSRPPDESFGHEPTVLVLAFKALADAEHYYLQMFRSPERAPPAAHRTVVLCGKDMARQAYDGCRRGIYDDYVVFWPFSDDISRLPMALHRAAEQLQNLPPPDPAAAAPAPAQSSRVDNLLNQQMNNCRDQIDAANQSLDSVVSDLRKAPPGTDARTLLPKVAGASAGMKNVSQWFDTVHGTIDGRINRESSVPTGAPVVLVADDDEYQAKLMGRILEHAGYQPIFACNGNEAIKQAGASHPDAILLDYAMPDLNGLQVLEQMAHIPGMPKIPVIMVTGNSQRDVILGSRKLGAVEYLVKPFESKALLTKLARALTHV